MLMQAKRKLPRSLSLVLAAILVFGMVLIPTNKTQAEEMVTVGNMNDKNPVMYNTYYKGDYTYSFKLPANGVLELDFFHASAENASASVYDSSGRSISYSSSAKSGTEIKGYVFTENRRFYSNLNAGQVYTLKISNYSTEFPVFFCLNYAPESATLTNGKEIYLSSRTNHVSYYKVNVKKNGYLHVVFKDACDQTNPRYSIKLFNAKKKAITHDYETMGNSNGGITTFGVKKGTYYLGVTTVSNSPIYTIKATTKAIATKTGAKATKAVTLKKGKVKKGIIYAKNKRIAAKHWYKFKITKRTKVKLYITAMTSSGCSGTGGLKVSVIPAKGYNNSASWSFNNNKRQKAAIALYTIGNKKKTLDPGVYYVCVSGYNYGNGYYSLKWK